MNVMIDWVIVKATRILYLKDAILIILYWQVIITVICLLFCCFIHTYVNKLKFIFSNQIIPSTFLSVFISILPSYMLSIFLQIHPVIRRVSRLFFKGRGSNKIGAPLSWRPHLTLPKIAKRSIFLKHYFWIFFFEKNNDKK